MPTYPFEASTAEIERHPEAYVDAVFACLESEFLVLPKGMGFVEYPTFEHGYERLKAATGGFSELDADQVLSAVAEDPMILIVLRTMMGFSPPEWACEASERTGVQVGQGFARTLDRNIRVSPQKPLRLSGVTGERVRALVEAACQVLTEGAPPLEDGKLHRLDKADTRLGLDSIRSLAAMGVPYAMLLYERFLGRPFAGHRDSVSELVGDVLESAIEEILSRAGISYRKTKRAERIAGFDQTPDFIVPDEFSPQVIIEAKITEDDGTARDKVTRIQHLAALSLKERPADSPRFEVVACISGRGFGVRREDMIKLIRATRGKVFTPSTLEQIIEHTRLKEYRTR